MKLIPYILIMLLGFSGCTIISNLDEISTLSSYSREKDNQHRMVKTIDDHYDALAKVIAQGHISEYKDKSSFIHSFGQPILKKMMSDGSERWLYRHAIYRFSKDQVNVYFDQHDRMIKWEKSACPKLF